MSDRNGLWSAGSRLVLSAALAALVTGAASAEEVTVGALYLDAQGFYGGIMGPANARRYFPMMATFFIFIVVSNYIGLLPGAGQVFTVPTATLSVTAGLAIIAFCMTHTVGIQRRVGLRDDVPVLLVEIGRAHV